MTRKHLRHLLTSVVGITDDFIINVCGHDTGCIRIIFPERCLVNGNSPLMYDYWEMPKERRVDLRVKQTSAKSILRACAKKLSDCGFTVTEKTIQNIEFKIPKKYVTEDRKSYAYILGEMENAVPKRAICPF